jgi:hypothetical protein
VTAVLSRVVAAQLACARHPRRGGSVLLLQTKFAGHTASAVCETTPVMALPLEAGDLTIRSAFYFARTHSLLSAADRRLPGARAADRSRPIRCKPAETWDSSRRYKTPPSTKHARCAPTLVH